MVRIVVRSLAGLFLLAILAYPMDWAVWKTRALAGGGMDQVSVRNVTVAALKGNKDEYFVDGDTLVDCSRSLFPQAGAGACWWLRRHNEVTRQD